MTVNQYKRQNTYTEIGGYSLSPHVGGFFWVTHHLHGVHLNTNSHNEHAALNKQARLRPGASLQMQQIQMRCSLSANLTSSLGSVDIKVLLQQVSFL